MDEKSFSRVEIVVVANGYKLREGFYYDPSRPVTNTPGEPYEFVFEDLSSLIKFLQESLLVPIEKR